MKNVNTQTKTPACFQPSNACVKLIAEFEGCHLNAYKCPAGVWTIGYGHTQGVKPGDTLASQREAECLLLKDLEKYATYVNSMTRDGSICFTLNQNQFDALTSFAYNCGPGNLRQLIQGRSETTVAEKMLLYDKGGGKTLPGLTKRREAERALFLTPCR